MVEALMECVWIIVASGFLLLGLFLSSVFIISLSFAACVALISVALGVSIHEQIGVAIISTLVISVFFLIKGSKLRSKRSESLDHGQIVKVKTVQADGTAQVFYRSKLWSAKSINGQALMPGIYQIYSVVGKILMLKK